MLRLPAGSELVAIAVAAAIWVGALLGALLPLTLGLAVLAGGAMATILVRRPVLLLLVLVGIGMFSGAVAADRVAATLAAPVPQGPGSIRGVATSDSTPYGDRFRFVVRPDSWQPDEATPTPWRGPLLAIIADSGGVTAGDRIEAEGLLRAAPGLVRGDPVAGRITAESVDVVARGSAPFMVAGNMVRDRVQARLGGLSGSPQAALLAGFLIGDIADLPRSDTESLRRAGLTHFVAVSGSNVALVLGAWWLVLGPIGAGNRIRAVTGLVVLLVFVVATRWESSVIRAATMAAIVLGGRAAGVPVAAWTALGGAIAILLAISGDLAYDVGFQLSVAATAGVLLGSRLWSDRSPRVLWAALAATVSAQLAVVPLLLLHFGTVPLLSPLANLVAAPLVTVATALAGIGVVINWDAPLLLAEQAARGVLQVARVAGEWPQLGPAESLVAAMAAGLAWKTRLRPAIVGAVAIVAVAAAIPPGPPAVPTITFLDVGQGDAVLVRDPSGAAILVDGGREPDVLHRALRRYGLARIDLLVATHGDADHAGGLVGLEEVVEIGRLWVPANQDLADILPDIILAMTENGVPVDTIEAGRTARLGEFEVAVLGPQRRYAKENDGSVVLWITARGRSTLLPGDIEAVAQGELEPLRPDLLLVPHHGSSSTDLNWLADTVGPTAVISVGENGYGHPDPGVVATLEAASTGVMMTLEEGDISVPFP